jgi:hypothetical protein
MQVDRRRSILSWQAVWMAVGFALLLVLDLFSVQSFYMLSFIGLLVVSQLFAPVNDTRPWWTWVRWSIWVGLLVLGVVIVQRSLTYL